jgi:hypothetical protein
MKTVSDTLEPLVEKWSDPGDYPNAVAQSPLPSYDYLAGVEGELKLQLTDEEMTELLQTLDCESLDFWMVEIADIGLPDGIENGTWQIDKVENNVVTLSLHDTEPDPNWRDD